MVYYSLSSYNSNMFLVGILSWWYGDGLMNRPKIIKQRLTSSADFFSIKLMFSTLFAPFRQISAGQVSGPLNYQIRAFFDRLISRFIGAFMRFLMILAGVLSIYFSSCFWCYNNNSLDFITISSCYWFNNYHYRVGS